MNNRNKYYDKTIDQSIKNIPEFKDKNTMHYIDLKKLYARVKKNFKFLYPAFFDYRASLSLFTYLSGMLDSILVFF